MDTKVFLQGFDSKKSSNTSEGLDAQFKGRRKFLPLDGIAEVVSQFDQYIEEREKCNKLRLTFQINPICSNVLFNQISEIIKDEGSSGATFINYGLLNVSLKNDVFNDVVFKRKDIEFWSGGSMNYQSVDKEIKNVKPQNSGKLSEIYFDNKYHEISDYNIDGVIKQTLPHPTNAIRDTQLSKKNIGFIYHCGLDFLNNHLIRSNTFKSVCRCFNDSDSYENSEYTAFNTIADLMRNVEGKKVVEKLYFPVNETPLRDNKFTKLIPMHLYEYDDILTFENCKSERLISKYNGWVGFENKPKIKSYSSFTEDNSMEIEKPLMNYNGGDFVDMYPSRDLYSFVPKYNNFQKRIEKNWNYCITYPSSSYTPSSSTEPFGDIIETNDGLNSLKAIYFDENIRADNGTTQLVIYSIAKHGLSKGDYVNIYITFMSETYWIQDISGNVISRTFYNFSEANDELEKLKYEYSAQTVCGGSKLVEPDNVYSASTSINNEKILDNAEVTEIVDDYIFMVFNSNTQISRNWVFLSKQDKKPGATLNIDDHLYRRSENGKYYYELDTEENSNNGTKYYVINQNYVNFDNDAQHISYKKVVNDIECNYYIRIFSKLPNFKFASGDTSSEYEIYRQRENGETMLSTYQDKKYDFENHISRLAFAKNIYTDEVGELVFTDDIDISNIHDNLGRPLTSLYLTIIKNNKGYKEWYGFSHINKWEQNELHTEYENIEFSHCFGPVSCCLETSEESIVDENVANIHRISYNNFRSNSQSSLNSMGYNTTVLNGAREYRTTNGEKRIEISNPEIWYDTDKHFFGDLCYYDSYNAIERRIQYVNYRFNTAQRESSRSESISSYSQYFYDEIIRDDYDVGDKYIVESSIVDRANEFFEGYFYIPHYEILVKSFDKIQTIIPDFLTIRQMIKISDGVYKFTTLEQHFLSAGDKSMIYDPMRNKYYKLVTISGDTDNFKVFTCNVYDEETDEQIDITYISGRTEVPIYELSTKINIGTLTVDNFKLFKIDNLNVPSYARVIKDGTCSIIWRNILNNGFNKSDNSIEEYPFTNGAFYINKRIDLYVRRQDPYGIYGLYNNSDIVGNSLDYIEEDNYIKEADIEC